MKKLTAIFILSLLLITGTFALTGKDIMQKVNDEREVNSSAMDIQMQLINQDGSISYRRIQTLIMKDKGLTKTITLFMEPASIKNTRFLTIENKNRADDQWIYLPALRKVKRIASGEKSGSFMGSDFSYADMGSAGSSISDSIHTVLKEEL